MCTSPKAPKPPPVAPEAPTLPDEDLSTGGSDERRRRAATGKSANSTILTSSRGVTESGATSTKTLLGQ